MPGTAECIVEEFNNPLIAAARGYYDPLQQVPESELGAFLLERYDLPESDPDAPEFTTALAADMLTVCQSSVVGVRLGAQQHPQATEVGIQLATQQVAERSQEICHDIPDLLPYRRALIAADRLAWEAHHTEWRRSGKNAYQHPVEAAAVALAGIEAIEEKGHIVDRQTKEQAVIGALLHDTFEDTTRQTSLEALPHTDAITPLLVQHTLRNMGVGYAARAAVALRDITRAEGSLPPEAKNWARPYRSYIEHGRQNPDFCLIKPADTIHNSQHDPKPTPTPESEQAWQQKLSEYSWSLRTLHNQATIQAECPDWPDYLPHYIRAVAATRPEEMPTYLRRLESFIGHPLMLRELGELEKIAA